ncbi:hypothetical protein ACE6H2_001029 [Prunus campanulata]
MSLMTDGYYRQFGSGNFLSCHVLAGERLEMWSETKPQRRRFMVVFFFKVLLLIYVLGTNLSEMDAISQLQEKVNTIATIAFTTIGTLQRDAPPVRISPNYPESGSGPAPAPNPNPTPTPTADSDADFAKQPKLMSAELVKAAKQFDALVAALPLSEGGEEAQLKRIAQLEAENDAVGQQLEKQLEAAERELQEVRELFGQAADHCLNLKKPE